MRTVGVRDVCKEDGTVNDWRSWRGSEKCWSLWKGR